MSKKHKGIDTGQGSLLDFLQKVEADQRSAFGPVRTRGKSSADAALRALIAQALKNTPLSRYEVAASMSEILGVSITKEQIDAWAAESKKKWRLPVVYLHAFCEATGDYAIVQYLAEQCGGYFVMGEDALDLALGRIDESMRQLKERQRTLRALKKRR